MSKYTIEIPDRILSLNKFSHLHWAQKKRVQNAYCNSLAVIARTVPRATGHRFVHITRLMGKGKRRYDRDNLIGGAKPLMDALVKEGILVDDTEEYVTAEYSQERCKQEGTRIEISEG